MDPHLQECNHAYGDCWSHEPLYAVRPNRYPAHTIPQPGVGQATRNVGHGQHAGKSREAPGGNKGQRESTLCLSIATMGGQEFKEGKKLAYRGYGLDDDWQEVMEMCSLEVASLQGSRLLLAQQHHNKSLISGSKGNCLMLAQQHQNKIIRTECEGFRLSLDHRHHDKLNSQLTSGSCLSHGRMYLRDYPKVHFWANASRTPNFIAAIVCLNSIMAFANRWTNSTTTK